MGLFDKLFFSDPEKQDKEELEYNTLYQNTLSDADLNRRVPDDEFRETNTIEDMEEVEEDNKWWQWGVRRN